METYILKLDYGSNNFSRSIEFVSSTINERAFIYDVTIIGLKGALVLRGVLRSK